MRLFYSTSSIIVLIIIFTTTSFAQSLSVFDVDVSNFPIIKAKFNANNEEGEQILNLTPSDFDIKESTENRNIIDITCPFPQPPDAISSVLTIDISNSMTGTRLEYAKQAAKAWVNALPLGLSECAITTFNTLNYYNSDFTTNKQKLLDAIDSIKAKGAADINAGFINSKAGALLAAEKGKHKKIVVFLTDGSTSGNEDKIIQLAEQINATIYCVTLDMNSPQILKNIAELTGGQWYENISTEASQIFMQILQLAQGGGTPCEIEWKSKVNCQLGRNVEISCLPINQTINLTYSVGENNITKLDINPMSIMFGGVEPGASKDTIITVTALNAAFNVADIVSNNIAFDINSKTFSLEAGESRDLSLTFTPIDSVYAFSRFSIESTPCENLIYVSGGFSGVSLQEPTIKLTHPNGGESFFAGTDTIITWEGTLPDEELVFEYSYDNGQSWRELFGTTSDFSAIWNNIPKTPSNNCLMKIKQYIKNEDMDKWKWTSLSINGWSAEWSPDGSMIAYSSAMGITIINSVTWDTIRTLTGHSDYVYSLSWSPDSSRIASGSLDKTIKVWEVSTGREIYTLAGHTDWVNSVCWSPDGTKIASGSDDNTIKIWDASTGTEIRTLSGHSNDVNSVSWSPDGTKIASGSLDNTIKVWDALTGEEIRTLLGHSWYVFSVSWSPDGTKIASGSLDNSIKIWDMSTGGEILSITGHSSDVNTVSWSPDGSKIASGSRDNTIKIWDALTGMEIRTLLGHNNFVYSVSWNPDGTKIASGSSDNTIKVWNVSTGAEVHSLSGHGSDINSVSWSPDGTKIASGSLDNTIKVWDALSGEGIRTLTGHNGFVYSVQWSPDGNKIASGSRDNTIKIWDVSKEEVIRTLSGHSSGVLSVCWSPDGSKIASGSWDGTVKVWDASSGAEIHTLRGHSNYVYSVCWSPDGSKIVSGSNDKTIIIWDASSETEIRTLSGHSNVVKSVGWSPDGSKIASGSDDNTIKIWDAYSGAIIRTISGHSNNVNSISWSPNSSKIASGSDDATIKVWAVISGKEIRTFSWQSDGFKSVIWNPEGTKIASGSVDATIKVWDVYGKFLQEDISDSVWSITAPIASSLDIDLQQVLVGEIKDSVVTGFISNTGLWQFRVDSIYFEGIDASAFSLVSGFPKYKIDSGGSHHSEFRFQPTEARNYKADIVVITQADTLYQSISGEGVLAQLKTINEIIDMGRIQLGYIIDTTISAIIENIGPTNIDISNVENAGPDAEQFSIVAGGGMFSLLPGESKEMRLRFTSKEAGRTSGSLAFYYDSIGSPAIVQLFSEVYKVTPKITTNSPICTGQDLLIYTDSVPDAIYHWSGPNDFKSNNQNIVILDASPLHSGEYNLYTTINGLSSDTGTVIISITTKLVSPGDSSLIFVGTAERIDDYIKLTNPVINDAGSVWLKNRFTIKRDFSTTFQFRVRYGDNNRMNEKSIPGADGFAFVLQNHYYPVLGSIGGAMGYNGITNSLAVEFDLYQNKYDPNGNHIAVQSMGAEPNNPFHTLGSPTLGMNVNILEIQQDYLYYTKIVYEWTTQSFIVYLDTTDDFSEPVLIINDIDMTTHLNLEEGEYVYLGFTAGTGTAFQEHAIFNWVIPCNNQLISGNYEFNPIKNQEVFIYPNPCADKAIITIDLVSNGTVSLTLLNTYGQTIESSLINQTRAKGYFQYELDTSSLSDGIYFIILQIGGKSIFKTLRVIR